MLIIANHITHKQCRQIERPTTNSLWWSIVRVIACTAPGPVWYCKKTHFMHMHAQVSHSRVESSITTINCGENPMSVHTDGSLLFRLKAKDSCVSQAISSKMIVAQISAVSEEFWNETGS